MCHSCAPVPYSVISSLTTVINTEKSVPVSFHKTELSVSKPSRFIFSKRILPMAQDRMNIYGSQSVNYFLSDRNAPCSRIMDG